MLAGLIPFRYLYILGFAGFFFCLPISEFFLSISQVLLILTWILEGNYHQKWRRFTSNTSAKKLLLLYLLPVLALVYTSNFGEAFNDLRIKLPILLLPIIFASVEPFTRKEYGIILSSFLLGCLLSVGFSTAHFYSLEESLQLENRYASRFVSHIRLSLMLALAIFSSIIISLKGKASPLIKLVLLSASAILTAYLINFQFITGLILLAIAFVISVLVLALSFKKKSIKLASIFLLISAGLFVTAKIFPLANGFLNPIAVSQDQKIKTSTTGGIYHYKENNLQLENGYRVWYHVCEYELELAWNKRSDSLYLGQTSTGQPIRNSLIRYLTSKGVYKDRRAVEELSESEIRDVENGATNYLFGSTPSIEKRIYETFWEMHNYLINNDNPSGNSTAQRLEYWRTGTTLALNNPLIGVGRGDLVDEMKNTYVLRKSKLAKEYYEKPHNQFITIFAAYGLIGLVVFLFVLYHILSISSKSYISLAFALIVMLSMLTEDTLETQTGVSFFIGFACLFLIRKETLKYNRELVNQS